MTDKTRKQLVALAALISIFIAVMFVVSRGEGPTEPSPSPSNQTGRREMPAGVPQVADVNLEALKAEHHPPGDPERNLFVFRQRAAPAETMRPQRSRPVEVAPPVPTGPPPPPPIQLKFIGVLERAGVPKVAILSDGRGSTFHAREGEDVDGRYRVIRIGTDSIELSYVDGQGRQTLRLSGQ